MQVSSAFVQVISRYFSVRCSSSVWPFVSAILYLTSLFFDKDRNLRRSGTLAFVSVVELIWFGLCNKTCQSLSFNKMFWFPFNTAYKLLVRAIRGSVLFCTLCKTQRDDLSKIPGKEGTVTTLQAWTVPEGSKRLRLPQFLDNRHMKMLSVLCPRRQPYAPATFNPQEIFLVIISIRG